RIQLGRRHKIRTPFGNRRHGPDIGRVRRMVSWILHQEPEFKGNFSGFLRLHKIVPGGERRSQRGGNTARRPGGQRGDTRPARMGPHLEETLSGEGELQIFHPAQGDVGAAGVAAPTDHGHPDAGPGARTAAENHFQSGLGQQVGRSFLSFSSPFVRVEKLMPSRAKRNYLDSPA
ncbi:Hypothetical predicted protein, partial [Cloeon dipterum]